MAKPSKKGKKRGKFVKNKRKQKVQNQEEKSTEPTEPTEPTDDSSIGSVAAIQAKGEWKSIEFDVNLFNANELDEFTGLEELTDYELVRGDGGFSLATIDEDEEVVDVSKNLTETAGQKRKQDDSDDTKLSKKQKKANLKKDEEDSESLAYEMDREDTSDVADESKRTSKEKQKKKGKKGQSETKFDSGNEAVKADSDKNAVKTKSKLIQSKEDGSSKKGKPKASTQRKEKDGVGSYTRPVLQENQDLDMSAWESLGIPSPVLKALQDMSFTKPTPIQSECIPAAIRKRQDIMGAAETGSGKTLAFGIPVIHHILRLKNLQKYGPTTSDNPNDDEEEDDEPDEFEAELSDLEWEESDQEDNDKDKDEEEQTKGDELVEEEEKEDTQENEEEEEEDPTTDKNDPSQTDGLFALIMTPTRELAVQVKNHLVAIAKYTDIKIAVICGGISAEKQTRVLKKKPEIVVGTPGRLWELYAARSSPHLLSLAHVRYLVIDEADRMVERGHYMELANIMDLLNGSHMHKKRQTMIFSATLTMVNMGPLNPSSNPSKYKDRTQLDTVLSKVAVHEDAKIVDLTHKQGTVATLMEAKIVCNFSEKDIYLYYFLLQYPGRTLVFLNSIEAIRRLVTILTLLQCDPLPLHSSMHQKQRLKNLDRFAANPRGVCLATDVASRGLDIPNVQHVLHYHVPKTSEIYIHRSGRTARASKAGLSVIIVSAQEVKSFRRVCKGLNRNDLNNFPTEHRFFESVEERVILARKIDKLELSVTKKKKENQWYENAAKDLDVELDDMILNDIGSEVEQKEHTGEMRQLRGGLKSMLKQKIFPRWSSQLYPTLDGTLVKPFVSTDAAHAMSNLKVQVRVDEEEAAVQRARKKKKFAKFKKTRMFRDQAEKNKSAKNKSAK